MPELPEAEITKQKLKPLIGKIIYNFWTNLKSNLKLSSYVQTKKDIVGKKIIKISRWGKVILFYLKNNSSKENIKILAFHQKMSGRLILKKSKEIKKFSPYIHFIIYFNNRLQLWFEDQRKFGIVWYGDKNQLFKSNYFKNLGPDILNIKFQDFKNRLTKHKCKIKTALLNQKIVAGIGNILADEILWASKIHPQTKISNLNNSQLKNIWRSSQKIIKRSIKFGGTSMRNWLHPDEIKGNFQNKTYVYGRLNKNCPRCKTKIIKIKIAGRGTYLCPSCQRLNN